MDRSEHGTGSPGWQEDDSQFFIQFGDAITPSRREHETMLAALVPAGQGEEFFAVDLACGAGRLSAALLERFPRCRVLSLDGSPRMLEEARRNLARFGDRADFGQFDLFDRAWLTRLPGPARCVVSSLAIHHLDGPAKRHLFRDLCERIEPGGALLILDLVEPVNRYAWSAYAEAWDAAVKEQAAAVPEGERVHEHFRQGWNHYATPDLEFDKPSGLYEQLRWLEEAGFRQVDCFWLRAGHALYGGYKV